MADRSRSRRPLTEVDAFDEELPIERMCDGSPDTHVRKGATGQVRGSAHPGRQNRRSPGTFDHGNAWRSLEAWDVRPWHADRVVHVSALECGHR